MPSINSRKQFISLPLTIGLIVVSLLLILFDGLGFFNTIKSSGHSIGIKITEKSSSSIERLFNISDLFKDKKATLQRVEELEINILTLRSENAQLSTLLKELEVIKEQNTFTNPAETLPASVTAYISDRYGYVVINKGSINNVKTGDAIVLKNLFLGEIVEVNKTNSIVRLINSPDTVIPALSMDNNAKGVVRGDFSVGLVMTDIPRGSTINMGESILTSSENEIIQKGLILGEVVSIEDSDSLTTKSALLKIIPDLRNLSEVFIIRTERNNE